ncbi:hypothetical protein [Paractinoplanes hotanensis]|uniref:Uncharacterized protein n=1 Tax=Paractinoplanes hotanensis TaxID=2906497 RepID=A0ABT0YEW7_9ACTN|nr:hypothetical protein [Actinoplanes hotanensis]MCM4084581.1 hypothetical protein [Actinoplanes hotanensis]
MLSTTSRVTYRFKTKPNASTLPGVYSVHLSPAGLSLTNKAKPGTKTKVAIKLLRTTVDPDAKRGTDPKLSKLTAQMSPDSGKTFSTSTPHSPQARPQPHDGCLTELRVVLGTHIGQAERVRPDRPVCGLQRRSQ